MALSKALCYTKSSTPVSEAPHQLQSRPHVVDGGDFYVHQPRRQRYRTDHVFGDVRGNARSLLRPGDPQRTGRLERAQQSGQAALQNVAADDEALNEGECPAEIRRDGDTVRQLSQRRSIAPGRIDDRSPRPGLDTELFY